MLQGIKVFLLLFVHKKKCYFAFCFSKRTFRIKAGPFKERSVERNLDRVKHFATTIWIGREDCALGVQGMLFQGYANCL
jgi:hypothetical protein